MNEKPKAHATDLDPAHIASLVNAMFEDRIPVIHRLGIRIVEVRDGLIVGAAPIAGNLNYQGSMYAGTLFGLGEALGAVVFAANFDLSRFTATVKDVQIRYRRPAMTDVRAEASVDASTVARLKREAEEAGPDPQTRRLARSRSVGKSLIDRPPPSCLRCSKRKLRFFSSVGGGAEIGAPMSGTRSRSGILVAVAAAAGAFGAAAMMASATPPTARADDSTLIIDAIDGDFAAGQADFTAALTDFGSGDYVSGLAAFFDGVDQDSVAAPDNLVLGAVEALEGDPITSSLYFGELSAPGSFADALSEAQILFNLGEGLLSNGAAALAAGDFGAGTYEVFAGSADAYVLPVEELLLGAAAAFDPVAAI